jgi:multicomponent K+:H+ antiporter subunit C
MEIVLAIAIGALTGSGVWLLLRPRTYQVIMGLALLSYAVNLFIFSMGARAWPLTRSPCCAQACPRIWRTMPIPCPRRWC